MVLVRQRNKRPTYAGRDVFVNRKGKLMKLKVEKLVEVALEQGVDVEAWMESRKGDNEKKIKTELVDLLVKKEPGKKEELYMAPETTTREAHVGNHIPEAPADPPEEKKGGLGWKGALGIAGLAGLAGLGLGLGLKRGDTQILSGSPAATQTEISPTRPKKDACTEAAPIKDIIMGAATSDVATGMPPKPTVVVNRKDSEMNTDIVNRKDAGTYMNTVVGVSSGMNTDTVVKKDAGTQVVGKKRIEGETQQELQRPPKRKSEEQGGEPPKKPKKEPQEEKKKPEPKPKPKPEEEKKPEEKKKPEGGEPPSKKPKTEPEGESLMVKAQRIALRQTRAHIAKLESQLLKIGLTQGKRNLITRQLFKLRDTAKGYVRFLQKHGVL